MSAEQDPAGRAREAADAAWRADSRRILATLIRLLGDFDLAEEALHDAFAAALESWPSQGVPANPRAWLPEDVLLRMEDRSAPLCGASLKVIDAMAAVTNTPAPDPGC